MLTKPISLGTAIATRCLSLVDGPAIVVTVGMPCKYDDTDEYYCPFQIVGLGRDSVNHASGADSMQALLLALKKIGAILNASEQAKSGRLYWFTEGNSDLGFPIPDSMLPKSG